jgi:pimeloyl-ACP methyl ester carboxylesterase
MPLIHHVSAGTGHPPLVLVHGFSCDHTDWGPQIAHFSPSHRCVAVDLPGHGQSRAAGAECSIEAYGAAVAAIMRTLDLPPSIVIGHSMGCRVAVEVAMQVPERTAGIVLVDGSQFNAATETLVRRMIAEGKLDQMLQGMFSAMFNEKSAPAVKAGIVERALRLPKDVAAQMTFDAVRYDMTRLEPALAAIGQPMMVIQTTYTNEKRERMPMQKGQSVPYIDMVRRVAPKTQIEVIAGYGHFPQLDAPAETNALIARFIGSVKA